MSIRNILVAFNGTDAARSALHLAVLMARTHDAHLTGLHAHSLPTYYGQMGSYMTPDLADHLARQEQEAADRVKAAWDEAIASEDIGPRTSFHTVQQYPNDAVSAYARTYDLVVVAQPEGQGWDQHAEPDPDSVALYSGRPVLVAPAGYAETNLPTGAIVAWDGKRAAARALSEAMSILEEAHKITVLHVGEDSSEIRQPGRDIMEHLSRHGISAELLNLPKAGRSTAEVVLETAQLSGAGLLVMGAYEHSRFAETLLGGVTRDVLRKTKMPVLIAH